MNSNLVMIVTVVIAALIVGGAAMYVVVTGQQQSAVSIAIPVLKTQAMGEQVVIPDQMTACGAGDRCLVVDTTCSFCCKYVAINAAQEKLFDEMFNRNCAGFSGTMCECFDLNSYPACVQGKCTMVKFDGSARPAVP